MVTKKETIFHKGVPIYTTDGNTFVVPFSPGNTITYTSIDLAKKSIDNWKKAIKKMGSNYAQ